MIRAHRRASTLAATAGLVIGSAVAVAATAGAAAPPGADPAGYTVKGAVPSSSNVTVDVSVPLRHEHALNRLLAAQTRTGSGHYHQWLTPQQFRNRFGVTDAQIRTMRSTLAAKHVSVQRLGAQAVAVSGPSATVAKLFSTRFERVKDKGSTGGTRIAAANAMKSPHAVRAIDGRPVGLSPQIRMHSDAVRANRYGEYGKYWFDDLKQAYKYPAYGDNVAAGTVAGKGQTIGILMSNAPSPKDLKTYFTHENATPPKLTIENVNGGAPFDPNASFESNLDVQQSGGMAPNATIRFYNLPDLSDENVFAGYEQIDEDNVVDEVSSSFGECELFYTAKYNGGKDYTYLLQAYDDLFKQGNAQGITFAASTGDSGALGCTNPGYVNGQKTGNKFTVGVSSPAEDPHVTAVGGTNLTTTYQKDKLTSSYISENAGLDTEVPYDPYGLGTNVSGGVWGTGGGQSKLFTEPAWQKSYTANTSGYRQIPDVSLHMGGCPAGISDHCNPVDSADVLVLGGDLYGVIGTSASSPDFAGTMALYNEAHHTLRSGNINPTIYKVAAAQRGGGLGYTAFHSKIPGDNGYYQTTYTTSGGRYAGYDEVIGNGTLVAKNFIFGRSNTPAAGNPQTPTNP